VSLRRYSKQLKRGLEFLELEDREYYALKLAEVRDDLVDCREGGKSTALAVLHRLEVELKEKAPVDELDRLEVMDPAELMGVITDAVVQLPAVLQDELRATLAGLAAGQVVKMPTKKKSAK